MSDCWQISNMLRAVVAASIGCCLCLLFASCASARIGRAIPEHQLVVDRMASLLSRHTETPSHLKRSSHVKKPNDLNLEDIVQVMTNISVEIGYGLDYICFLKGGLRRPAVHLYARKTDQEAYKSIRDYRVAVPNDYRTRVLDMPLYMDHIRSDGSPEGFTGRTPNSSGGFRC